MLARRWAVRASAAAVVASLSLAACGGDDGAGVRTIDDDSSASGSGSASGSSGSVSGSSSGSVTESESE